MSLEQTHVKDATVSLFAFLFFSLRSSPGLITEDKEKTAK
jgi:hypothetical protein